MQGGLGAALYWAENRRPRAYVINAAQEAVGEEGHEHEDEADDEDDDGVHVGRGEGRLEAAHRRIHHGGYGDNERHSCAQASKGIRLEGAGLMPKEDWVKVFLRPPTVARPMTEMGVVCCHHASVLYTLRVQHRPPWWITANTAWVAPLLKEEAGSLAIAAHQP